MGQFYLPASAATTTPESQQTVAHCEMEPDDANYFAELNSFLDDDVLNSVFLPDSPIRGNLSPQSTEWATIADVHGLEFSQKYVSNIDVDSSIITCSPNLPPADQQPQNFASSESYQSSTALRKPGAAEQLLITFCSEMKEV